MKFKLVTWEAVKQYIKMQTQCFDLPLETIQQQISFFNSSIHCIFLSYNKNNIKASFSPLGILGKHCERLVTKLVIFPVLSSTKENKVVTHWQRYSNNC